MEAHIYSGRFQKVLPLLASEGKTFDLIIVDPPYGTTNAPWDYKVNWKEMWGLVKPLLKPNGVVVMFGQNVAGRAMAAELMMSNEEWFREELIWNKKQGRGRAEGLAVPTHENIMVFAPTSDYYVKGAKAGRGKTDGMGLGQFFLDERIYTEEELKTLCIPPQQRQTMVEWAAPSEDDDGRDNVLRVPHSKGTKCKHAASKPHLLLQYLVSLYSPPGATVLDFTMGSGNSMVATALANSSDFYREKAVPRVYYGAEISPETLLGAAKDCWLPVLKATVLTHRHIHFHVNEKWAPKFLAIAQKSPTPSVRIDVDTKGELLGWVEGLGDKGETGLARTSTPSPSPPPNQTSTSPARTRDPSKRKKIERFGFDGEAQRDDWNSI